MPVLNRTIPADSDYAVPRRPEEATDFGYRSVAQPLLAGEVCGRETAVGRW